MLFSPETIHYMIPDNLRSVDNEVNHTVTAAAETSVTSVIGLLTTKTRLRGGNYYADKLLFLIGLHIAVILTLNTPRDNEVGGDQYR